MHSEGKEEEIIVVPNQVRVTTTDVLRSHSRADGIRISHRRRRGVEL